MRASLSRQGLPDARTVAAMKNGEKIRYAGLVICRQRPGTAGGVVFMTLEDETGFVNVVVWESVFQRYSVLAKTLSFRYVRDFQAEDNVVHLLRKNCGSQKCNSSRSVCPVGTSIDTKRLL
jgi:error-prone DNA polymerase